MEIDTARILIIDDEPLVRESIATYLEDSGFEILQAGDGPAALQRLAADAPDLLLLDLRMPEMDGLEVLSHVRQRAPEIPVVVVSGTGVIQDAIEALRRGAWDFVTKPIQDMAVLEHNVRSVLQRARLMVENRKYREHLETEIEKRTAALNRRTKALEQTNQQLQIAIEERRQAERSLQQKVEEQGLLLENTDTQIWYLTDVDTYGAANSARAAFLGKTRREVAHRQLGDFLGPAEAKVCVNGNRRVFEERQQIHTEEWARNAEGQRRLLSIIKTPKLDSEGRVEYVVCSAEDITAYREAVDSLRRHKERLSLALEASEHAIWDWNLSDNTAYFSSRYYTMLGYEPHERTDSLDAWKILIHPDDRPAVLDRLASCLKGDVSDYRADFRMKTKEGGWRWILGRGKIVERDEQGRPVRMIGSHVDITQRKLTEEALRESEATLRVENVRLRSTLKGTASFGRIVGKSIAMKEVYELILRAAGTNANTIIYGESGTGKELVAQTIHQLSDRSKKSFVTVNCGAIPEHLIESEFFGYTKGAFTGAHRDKEGYLASADGGVLFLDEIGEIDLNMQVKLLRAIDGGGYMPLGSRQSRQADIRIIAATNRDLKELVEQGRMREDFFYRIHIVPISMPPLRERKEDIPLLINHFLQDLGDEQNVVTIPESILKAMINHDWPGNVRELQNAIHRFITLREVDFLDLSTPSETDAMAMADEVIHRTGGGLSLNDMVAMVERKYIHHLLDANRWQRAKVASMLGINRRTLFRKMKTYQIE